MKLNSNIAKFYAFQFLGQLLFIIPIIVLFWQANGLSLTKIMILQSLFAISIVFWELPTGVFADKFGRKKSLVLGAFFLAAGLLVYSLGFTFWQFFAAEFIWAIGLCFISGADSAFIYDTLKQTKKEKNFKKVWGNATSFSLAAAAIGAIIGGFIATYSLRVGWYLSTISMIFLFFVALTFKEPKHYRRVKRQNYWEHTLESFRESFMNKNLLFVLLFSSLLSVVSKISLWFYQPYMQQSGLPLFYFGIVWASFSIFAIGGSKYAYNIERILGEKGSLWLMVALMVLSLIFMSYWFVIFGFAFIFIQQIVRGFSEPVLQDYSHNHISDSRKRATLLSIQSLAGSLVFAITGPFYGYIADKYSLSNALLFTAVSFLIAFTLLMFWNAKRKR